MPNRKQKERNVERWLFDKKWLIPSLSVATGSSHFRIWCEFEMSSASQTQATLFADRLSNSWLFRRPDEAVEEFCPKVVRLSIGALVCVCVPLAHYLLTVDIRFICERFQLSIAFELLTFCFWDRPLTSNSLASPQALRQCSILECIQSLTLSPSFTLTHTHTHALAQAYARRSFNAQSIS